MGNPGPEGSVGKLASAELNIRIWNAAIDLIGHNGMLHEAGYPLNRDDEGRGDASVSKAFLRSQANTIEEGPQTSCATSWASGCSASPATSVSTKAIPWTDIPT
ncbi:MAG: acyl-CoA dehydrogenase family protein [Acidimicrobiales bacterium]